ncbi:MAG: 5'-methylthioadenosine/adenosylhomocysteine nucleosidase [Clostridia bacterium]|nr:5'-methylthioadenosine/adenosylhomocysteine nucleosidase [Clostridia bacterium]
MSNVCDIGIIGAMTAEVEAIISSLSSPASECVSGIKFYTGILLGKRVAVATSGVGKVFAALAAEAMILKYSPRLIINTGVGGAISGELRPLDIVFAERVVQHDMDTSPLGDPKGLISGINKIYFSSDERAVSILSSLAEKMKVSFRVGTVATGDRFVCSPNDKRAIYEAFSADVCEMEGGAIAQTAYVNSTPFVVVRAISDSADGDASMDYSEFLPRAAKISTELTLGLVQEYPT